MEMILPFADDLLQFIAASPTPFHAVKTMLSRLQAAGFTQLREADSWALSAGGKYVVARNDSSIIAFVYGKTDPITDGVRMVGAHTDSPCLKVKPNADIVSQGYWQLGVEIYGGALLNPWFDRELGLAGKVSVLDDKQQLQHVLLNIDRAIGMVPNLAIHLDRDANNQKSVNAQKEMPVVLGIAQQKPDFRKWLITELGLQHPQLAVTQVLDYELSFYDRQQGAVYGVGQEFIASARLDNLLSCYVGLQALLQADGSQHALLVCNDHEEVGSASAAGAQGPMLQTFLQRLMPDLEDYARMVDASWFISADNAHAVHPNYAEKHDANHGPRINQGPVIKINANQRYASNSETQAFFRAICEQQSIPVQSFVVRSDMACGSTIGPITACNLGVRTVDIGVPTWAMHSIRETAGTKDALYLSQALTAFFNKTVV